MGFAGDPCRRATMSDATAQTTDAPVQALPPVRQDPFFGPSDKIAFGLATFVTFVVYLLTLQPSVGLEDSGELCTAAYHLGVPHPPGYPIGTILAWVWCHLIPVGSIAWRVNLMSAVFGAVAVGLAALLVSKTGDVMKRHVEVLRGLE